MALGFDACPARETILEPRFGSGTFSPIMPNVSFYATLRLVKLLATTREFSKALERFGDRQSRRFVFLVTETDTTRRCIILWLMMASSASIGESSEEYSSLTSAVECPNYSAFPIEIINL